MTPRSFTDHVLSLEAQLSPAERRVAQHFRDHREEVLLASAAELARKAGTSDATVIRTVRTLGYDGLDAMRRAIAQELRRHLSPAARIARTLHEIGDDLDAVFNATLDLHAASIVALKQKIRPAQFRMAVDHALRADRIAVFGIGPSGAMAGYLAMQLGRFGIDTMTLSDTGLLLADRLLNLRKGDLLVVMAYSRVYPELRALLDRADALGLPKILVTDTLGPELAGRVELVLDIPRGRADTISLHTATLAFIEAWLVGIASQRKAQTVEALGELNRLRAAVAGPDLSL
ncbi:putative phosphosugar isomerase [alpha proteobacterium BAL199]|jgi:DNA-binding MurR/RpiR family transcriptional regulator|nr:putative phosphosugar isomerase [alpha proteobacterium BAL199]